MRRIGLVAALSAAAILAGCTTQPPATQSAATQPAATPASPRRPDEVRTVTVAGGESIKVRIEHGDAKRVENSEIKIEVAGFVADRTRREIVFVFGFKEKKMEWPRSVTVEDVTGDDAEMVVSDASPRLTRDGIWRGTAPPLRRGDPGLGWLAEAGDTFKVFRLTILTADGRRLVMFQAAIWGPELKATFRHMLGYDEAAAS